MILLAFPLLFASVLVYTSNWADRSSLLWLLGALPVAFITSATWRNSVRWSLCWFATLGLAMSGWRWSSAGVVDSVGLVVAGSAIVGAYLKRSANESIPMTAWLSMGFVIAVSILSSNQGGAGRMLHWLTDHGASESTARAITLGFRKTVHFTAYGGFAWTVWHSLKPHRERFVTALLAAAAMAIFDEWRQSAFANRSASPWDVGLDLLGVVTFLGLSEVLLRRKR